MNKIYESYQTTLNENSIRDYIKNVLSTQLKKIGMAAKFKKSLGYDSYVLPNGTTIVSDGVGLKVKDKSGKEIKYFDRPKANYQAAAQFAGDQ